MLRNNQKFSNLIFPLIISVILSLFSVTWGCTGNPVYQRRDSLFLITDEVDFYYEIMRPKEKYFLPYALEEISGLSFLPNGHLLGVEDEGGKVYEYDLQRREIINSIQFAGPGDYEGVEVVDGMVYVLRSDGDIFRFPYTTGDFSEAEKYETKLSRDNDAEGLGFNPIQWPFAHCLQRRRRDQRSKSERQIGI